MRCFDAKYQCTVSSCGALTVLATPMLQDTALVTFSNKQTLPLTSCFLNSLNRHLVKQESFALAHHQGDSG